MKRILTALALIIAIALPASAKEPQTATIKLPTLQCGTCQKTIEGKLQDFEGLDSISVDVDEKVATVVFDAEVTSVAALEQAISKIGYDANEVRADKRAQKKLHPCCQPGAHE
jgi:periplasmic mercuric ion binding protein